jgi:hypothetical protein
MTRALVAALALLGACAHGPLALRSREPSKSEAAADSLYWRAVRHLDPSNRNGTLDSAVVYLDAYLACKDKLSHSTEAAVLRSLARNAQQLARLEAALQQARANADNRPRESDSKGRDEEYVKEIQRLKDELAKANEELERIKKRLAAPKP